MEDDVCDKKMTQMKKWGEKKAECLDDTSSGEMEEDVSDKKNDRSENIDERKEAEWIDDTSPDDMEEEVSDKIDNKNEKIYKEK